MKRNHRQSPYIFLVVQEVNSYRIFSVRNLFLFRVVCIKKLRIVVCIAGRTADCRYLFPIYFLIFHFLLKRSKFRDKTLTLFCWDSIPMFLAVIPGI